MSDRNTDYLLVLKAAEFAADKHRDQRRKDARATPYINHPLRGARILAETGRVTDPETLAAALLHDVIEDTKTDPEELSGLFGDRVASIVVEVSDNKLLLKETRKQLQIEHAPVLSLEAKLVKLGDKICNLEDVADNPPKGWDLNRRLDYFDWAGKVVAGLRGANGALEQLFDEVAARRPVDEGHRGR
jgi:GTP diphosphokinase / guanosine-3',5'-bis(diphosphate) 3'-diphosphatase